MPRSRRASRTTVVAVLVLVGLVAGGAPGHATAGAAHRATSVSAGHDGRPRTADDDGTHLLDVATRVADDVTAAARRLRSDVARAVERQRDAVAAWWTASAPAWLRDAARVGPALWDVGEAAAGVMREETARWLSWMRADCAG